MSSSTSTKPVGTPEGCLPKPAFLRIPLEIADLIAEHISHHDCKSLRLTCRFFQPSTIRLLFRSICLSKTKLDRDSFFNISQSPHLAAAVVELIWYELAEDETTFCWPEDEADELELPENMTNEDGNLPIELPVFFRLAQNAFWWTTKGSSQEFQEEHPMEAIEKAENSRKDVFDDFYPRFCSALDAMPHIHTFVCCPMPPMHVVSNKEYVLTAQLLRQSLSTPVERDDGFFNFLVPAMRRAQSKVKRLAYSDQGMMASMHEAPKEAVLAFQSLTHIDLCLGSTSSPLTPHENLDSTLTCLYAAVALEDLRICLENGPCSQNRLDDEFLAMSRDIVIWPRLRRLELTEVWMYPHLRKSKSLLKILEIHTHTLRHLVFHFCLIPASFLRQMSCIAGLQLKWLQIIEDNVYYKLPRIVNDAELLAYVNGIGPLPKKLVAAKNNEITCTSCSYGIDARRYYTEPLALPWTAEEDAACNNYDGILYTDDEIDIISEWLLQSHHEVGSYLKVKLEEGGSGLEDVLERPLSATWTAHSLFIHPSGQKAVGCEPLDFFSDWEDSESEDSGDETEE
ncbi:hypothetical protein CONLIGDRAFT_220350, partial [Coniochaeta ligniaria NRRL 30616]